MESRTPQDSYYLAPVPFSSRHTPDHIFSWSREFIQQGNAYLRSQPAYRFIDDGLKLINGDFCPESSESLSDVQTEATVRNIKELVASQTNIRIIPSFTTELADQQSQQVLLNNTYMAWQTQTFADRSLRKVWQYACAGGTGYAGVRWDPNFHARGKGDIVIDAYGPMDVLPVGLPHSHKIQSAYGAALKVTTPYHEAIRKYPKYADLIKPSGVDKKSISGITSAADKLQSIVLKMFGQGLQDKPDETPWATVDIYYIYLDDETVNETGNTILMGDPGTSWSYTVPSLGSQIPAGMKDGHQIYRVAQPEDCRLYPTRRLIACTDTCCLTPDPTLQVSPYWYPGIPLVQFRSDDWPWTYLGFPLSKAGISIERANISIMRDLVDSSRARLSPPRGYDRNTMDAALATSINPRMPNQVVGLDYSFGGEQLKPLLPSDYYAIPPQILEFVKENYGRIKEQMGVADASALTRARQLPAGDSTERLLEALGPLVKDQSRNMEHGVLFIGEMWKYAVFQFYRAPRMMQMHGEAGMPDQMFQFNIGDLVPDSVPGMMPGMDRFALSRLHASNFSFTLTPYSLHELNSLTRKMFFLQLSRAGFPISWWTMAEVFDIRNFGKKPIITDPDTGHSREAQTEIELWTSQKEIEIRMAKALQQEAGGEGGAPGGGPGKHPGRPPSGQQPPTPAMKAGMRPITRESSK